MTDNTPERLGSSEADFILESHSIDVIPDAARHGRPRDLFPMWFGANVQIMIVLSGALIIFQGLSMTWTVIATVLGLVVGGMLMAFHSAQGPHLGLPQMIQSRAQFGFYGANLPLLIAVLMYLGFFAAGTVLAAQALTILTSWSVPTTIPVVALAIAALTFLGYRAIHLFQKWLSIIAGVAFLALTVAAFATADDPDIAVPSVIGEQAGFQFGPFLLVVALNAILLLSYGPYVADYSRYLPTTSSISATFWYTFSASVLSCVWLMVLGAVLQNRYPGMGVVDQIDHVAHRWLPGFAPVMMVVIVLGVVGANALNAYGAFMSTATIGSSLRSEPPAAATQRFRLAYLLPIIAIAVVLSYLQQNSLLTSWQTLLSFLLYFLIPWTAVNLVDYYFVRKGNYDLTAFSRRDGIYGQWSAVGLTAYALGCLAQLPFAVTAPYTGPLATYVGDGDISWIVGILVGGTSYYLLARRANLGSATPAVPGIEPSPAAAAE